MKRISSVALALVSAALAAGPARAQAGSPPVQSGTRGLTVGLDLNGSAIASDGSASGTPRGAGLGLSLGYGVSDAVSIFVRTDYAYRVAHVDLGARYSFGGSASRLRPYVEGAFTRTGTTALAAPLDSHATQSNGYGFTGGAGVAYFVSRRVALDLGVSHSRGRFTAGALDGRDFASTRLNIGVKWHP
jgi:opacity protein-like surface antigen